MKRYASYCSILLIAVLSWFSITPATAQAKDGGSEVDVKEIILGHMSDAYEWHITTWGKTHISIPLPIIVKSQKTGWHIFCSSRLSEGKTYQNFFIDEEGTGKIYEKLQDGKIVRPLDISITKDVVQIWIVVALMLLIFIGCARWYRKQPENGDAPKGFVGMIEMFVMSIVNDVIKPSVGEAHYKPYTPFLLTAFFFIFITNLLGLLPIFPGGANVTGNITITFFLAICTFLAINLFGDKHYWKDIFWPEVPTFLKAPIPLMPVIEFFGVFTKPFALMIRLFANMVGGHATILALTCVIFITYQLGVAISASLSLVSFVLMIFMNALELLVAFIQAYVFTMLSAVFIGLAHTAPKAEKK